MTVTDAARAWISYVDDPTRPDDHEVTKQLRGDFKAACNSLTGKFRIRYLLARLIYDGKVTESDLVAAAREPATPTTSAT